MAHNGINETISVGVVTAHQVTERGRVAGLGAQEQGKVNFRLERSGRIHG